MKQKILVPSAVISIFSLCVGSFILSLDRIKSIENIQAQNQKQINDKQLMIKQERGQYRDQPMVVETAKKGERVRMGYQERANEQVWEERFVIPADERLKQRVIWI